MKTIDSVLDEISKHPLDEKEMIAEILNKRLIEEKRNLIYKDYKRAMRNFKAGETQSGNAEDLFKEIGK